MTIDREAPRKTAETRIVSVSSGLGSAFAWKLWCDRYGPDNVVGVFTDVNGEHPDNYRFLAEVQYRLGSRLIKLTNGGRTIWDVMIEERFLANTRVDICSRVLKREAFLDWLNTNCDPATTVIALGIDWTEMHRFDRAKPLWAKSGWAIEAPLCEPPYLHKSEAQAWLTAEGIARPKLYDLGFGHANCGGGCVKAGHGQFRQLLAADRWWYVNWWEAGEERVRRFLGRDDIAILRKRTTIGHERVPVTAEPGDSDYGEFITRPIIKTEPFTLRQLREEVDSDPQASFPDDEGQGCGVCFLAPDEERAEAVA